MARALVRAGANGKRRYSSKTVHGTNRDRQKHLNSVLRSQDLGQYLEFHW